SRTWRWSPRSTSWRPGREAGLAAGRRVVLRRSRARADGRGSVSQLAARETGGAAAAISRAAVALSRGAGRAPRQPRAAAVDAAGRARGGGGELPPLPADEPRGAAADPPALEGVPEASAGEARRAAPPAPQGDGGRPAGAQAAAREHEPLAADDARAARADATAVPR